MIAPKKNVIKILCRDKYIFIPRKKLGNDGKVWWSSNSTHKKNNIWMSKPTHNPYLNIKTKKR